MTYLIYRSQPKSGQRPPARLSKNGKWLLFGPYGTPVWAVKEYFSKSAALKKAKKLKGVVIAIPDGYAPDASGFVYDENDRRVPLESLVLT